MSALGVEEAGDGGRAPAPIGCLELELLSSGAGELVELGSPRLLGLPPFGVDEALSLEALQRDEQRPGVHLEHAARDLFDAARDPEPVQRLQAEGLEDEQVERALDDIG